MEKGFCSLLNDQKVEEVVRFLDRDHTALVPSLIGKDRLSYFDFLALLTPAAQPYLEDLLRRSCEITARRFGKNIHLYAPLYVSNECVNTCTYCGFSRPHKIKRRTLSLEEIEREAEALARTGIRNVLLLTGESPKHNPVPYLLEAAGVLRRYFHSVSIEIYPLSAEDYSRFHAAGVEGVTIYQETYNREIYSSVHPGGFKMDYNFRLATPERAADGGIRRINIGVLLGLAPWRLDAAILGMHLKFLEKRAWRSALAVSFPRIREAAQYLAPEYTVSDREFVQLIAAFRLFSPDTAINISTREMPGLRDHLVGLGPTSYSAGSRTDIGGYSGEPESTGQFNLEDHRSPAEVAAMISARGYNPVFKDWDYRLAGAAHEY